MSQRRSEPRDDSSFIHTIAISRPGPAERGPVYMSQGELPDEEQPATLFFDGNGAVIDGESGAAAMVVLGGDTPESPSYYVAVATNGPDFGHVYNPAGVYAKADDLYGERAAYGRKAYEFRRVAKETFEVYVEYLQQRIPSQYVHVDRMVLNA